MEDNRRLRVGYWLGDASLHSGGVGPYAWRTLRLLLSRPHESISLVVICAAQAEARAAELIARSPAAATTELRLLPQLPARLRSLLRRGASPAGSIGVGHTQPAAAPQARVRHRMKALLAESARGYRMNRWLARLNLDLLHFPTQLPVSFDVPVPYLVTMHDVQELHFPEYFTPDQRASRAVNYGAALAGARQVITSFDHIKSDLIKYFQVPAEKIRVCPLSLENLALQPPSVEEACAHCERYAAWKPYLLYPAQTWPHKNHLRLLESLSLARRGGLADLRLICTGMKNDYYPTIEARARELGLADAVLFTGILPEHELSWLYQHTALVTVPTEYEAGSYPLYEAMSEGVPVICSDVTSLPETIGDARFLFSPYDVEALARLIERMLTDDELRAANLENSAAQVARLRGQDPSEQFYEAYRSALSARAS
jgi:glycosyltransferase involved in cell wall biosynthesis